MFYLYIIITAMTKRTFYHIIFLFFFMQIILLHSTGCKKEYSYEGGDSLIIKHDTVIVPVPPAPEFPACSSCRESDATEEARWNFKMDNSFFCGVIDTGIITSDKNAFTFFGPSTCSIDTGLVITAYFEPEKLTSDKHNITTNKVAFYYYQHGAPYIFISERSTNFSITIESFIYATGIATGTFKGGVARANGIITYIKDGKFKVRFR